jgi:hypothetical protein
VKNLGPSGRRWLKAFHLLFVGLWIGGNVALVTMNLLFARLHDGGVYGFLGAMRFVDDAIIIPGAIGCLLTGLLYGLLTPWGFFKHWWVTSKWVLNITLVVVGTIWLGPWLYEMVDIAAQLGPQAPADPTFAALAWRNNISGPFMTTAILFMLFVSVFKPWKTTPGPTGKPKA